MKLGAYYIEENLVNISANERFDRILVSNKLPDDGGNNLPDSNVFVRIAKLKMCRRPCWRSHTIIVASNKRGRNMYFQVLFGNRSELNATSDRLASRTVFYFFYPLVILFLKRKIYS